jgi:hypothetical protein
MSSARSILVVGAAILAFAGCAPPKDAIDAIAPVTTSVAGEPVAAAPSGNANVEVCSVNQQTLELAVEMFESTSGTPAVDQQQLVDAQLLREVVPGFGLEVVDGTTTVVALPGGGCA